MGRPLRKPKHFLLRPEHDLLRIDPDLASLNLALWRRVRAEAEVDLAATFARYDLPLRLGQRLAGASQEEVAALAGIGPMHFRIANLDELAAEDGAGSEEPAPVVDPLLLSYWSTARQFARLQPRACSIEFGLPTAWVAALAAASLERLHRLAAIDRARLVVVAATHLEILIRQLQLHDDPLRITHTVLALYASLPSANPTARPRG